MVAHDYNSSVWEAEAGESPISQSLPWATQPVQGKPELYDEILSQRTGKKFF